VEDPVDRSDLGDLHQRADDGDGSTVVRLALEDRLEGPEDIEGLRREAALGDTHAAFRLVEVLASREDVDGLQRLADAGDAYASGRLADVLADNVDVDGLQERADAGHQYAADRLGGLLSDFDPPAEADDRKADGKSRRDGPRLRPRGWFSQDHVEPESPAVDDMNSAEFFQEWGDIEGGGSVRSATPGGADKPSASVCGAVRDPERPR
jgi:hypothetical protein